MRSGYEEWLSTVEEWLRLPCTVHLGDRADSLGREPRCDIAPLATPSV